MLAGSFAIPVLGLKDLIPIGVTSRGVRPVGDFPEHKIRWSQSVPMPEQDVRISRAFLDVEHDCACGWKACGMYATVCITGREFEKNKHNLKNLLDVKRKNAILMLEDLWNTAKNEPFIRHETCPKVVGAWRYSA